MAHPSPTEAPGESGNKKRKTNTHDALKYLKRDIDVPLPPEVARLVGFLDEEEQLLSDDVKSLRVRYTPNNPVLREELNKEELRIMDVQRFKKLLYAHAGNPNVKEVSDAMDKVYAAMFNAPMPEASRNKTFAEKAEEFLGKKPGISDLSYEDIHKEYVARNDVVDKTLDRAQTEHVVDLAARGDPNALFETYVTSMDRYQELTDKITRLPKQERDQHIDEFMKTLALYESLTMPDFEKNIRAQMEASARDVLDKQESQFKGLRGFIQRGIEKGTDFAIDHFAGVVGDKDSLARNLFVGAAKAGRDLAKPVTYDPALIKELEEETIAQVKTVATVVDVEKIHAMREACVALKSSPDRFLTDGDREAFRASFRGFLPVTVAFMKKIIEVNGGLIRDAYQLSHGENSTMFPADSTMRAKFAEVEGRDVLRTLQLYSPFGVFLPARVDTKTPDKPLYLESAYKQSWFRDHPIAGAAVQSAEFWLLYKTGVGVAGGAAKGVSRRLIGKTLTNWLEEQLKKPLGKVVPVVFQVLLGYELGDAVNQYRLSAEEEDIFNQLTEYSSLREIPSDVRQDLRQLILRNELGKRRNYFQGVGYDVGKLGMGALDNFLIGTGGGMSIRNIGTTMQEKGTFREAVLAANRKLVLLGFEPFELR